MFEEKIEEMSDGKEKELLKILKANPMPYMRKCDGYAAKMDEDTDLTFTNHEGQETTIKIPKGDYVRMGDGCYGPEIETAESFEKRNKIVGEKKKEEKRKEEPTIGLELMSEE